MLFSCPLCGEGVEYPRADLPYKGPCPNCNKHIEVTLQYALGPGAGGQRPIGVGQARRGSGRRLGSGRSRGRYAPPRQQGQSGLGIAAFVCSLIIPPLGLVLGLCSMDTSLGKAGMIIGLVFTVVCCFWWVPILLAGGLFSAGGGL